MEHRNFAVVSVRSCRHKIEIFKTLVLYKRLLYTAHSRYHIIYIVYDFRFEPHIDIERAQSHIHIDKHDAFAALCEQRSFYPRVVFESDNPEAVRKLIGTGVGVGFWPERTWKSTDTTTTRFSYLAEREFERTIAITRSSRVQPNTEAASFYQFLVDHFADIWNGRTQPPL